MELLWWLLGAYTAISVMWTVSQLGYKNKKRETWWELILYAPALCLATLLGAVVFIQDLTDRNTWRSYYWKCRLSYEFRKHFRSDFLVDGEKVKPVDGKRIWQVDSGQGYKIVERVISFQYKQGNYYCFTVRLLAGGGAESSVKAISEREAMKHPLLGLHSERPGDASE